MDLEQDTFRRLFTLDGGDEGFAIQLLVWSNDPEKHVKQGYEGEFMIQMDDLKEENITLTLRFLKRFLNKYKKKPLRGGVTKRNRRNNALACL